MIMWTDVESTGLDEREGHLLEVALVATDDDLTELGYSCTLVMPVGVDIDKMPLEDDFVLKMHTENNLLRDLKDNQGVVGFRRYEAEDRLIDAVNKMTGGDSKNIQLAGSNVGFDRRWLRHHMPRLEEMFHYRSIDVSGITELAKRWSPAIYEKRPKAGKGHRALADVRESISYLKYYREQGFIGLVRY